jgi:lipopolysaccharide/colanic/teichoic acid biosynthesis glycosyltransferase
MAGLGFAMRAGWLQMWNVFQRKSPLRSRHTVLRNMHSPARIRMILRRERMRTDRNGDPFCLVTFRAREPENVEGSLVKLVKTLKRRLRYTDDIGWLDAERVAVVLPSTPLRGAKKVADDICRSCATDSGPPLCAIYSYPADSSGEGRSFGERPKAVPIYTMEPLFAQDIAISKRCLDVVGAAVGLLALMPLLLLIAAGIRLTSRGPVLFSQLRTGWGGRTFVLFKFRTMVVSAEQEKAGLLPLNELDGPAFKIRRDPRVTPFGRFLRRFCLDELPQLWNVLIGDMSLVGPRPLVCAEAAQCTAWQRARLDIMPGLTCLWQVYGDLETSFADWVRMDLRYSRSRSLPHDFVLLLKTIPVLVLGRGRY